MNRLFVVVFLLILGGNAAAQKDYIVTLNADTLYGSITADNYARVKFTPPGSSEDKKFKADEILGYYKSKKNKTFHRVIRSQKNNGVSLLPLLVKGKINVYEYVVQNGSSVANVSYFASKNGKEFFEIKNNSFYGVFGRSDKQKDAIYELLKDNKALSERYIAENKSSIKNLIKIIEAYNADN